MVNLKAFGISCGIMWAIVIVWATLINLWGMGNIAFDCFDQLYFGLLAPTYPGLILNAAIGFVDALIAGVIFGLIYNKIAR